ncbi:MAG TPA: hypothetical protein VF230_00470 [Acidimicrobiales bacterium]
MAKVTVYVNDDQLEKLRAVKGFGRGGVSKMFQAFVESVTAGGEPTGRYDYARKLMPTHAAIERHRRRLARKVQTGGPPADGGPVSAALTVLLYRRLIEQDPSLAVAFEKEFARFGLDELVATETEGVDLLAEPEEDEIVEDDGDVGFAAPLGAFGIKFGDEVREAMKQVEAIRVNLRDLKHEQRTHERVRARGGPGGRRGRRLVVEVSSDDDPRDVLAVNDYETFVERHPDWERGQKLTPSQAETVRELLLRRAGLDPETEVDADDASAGEATTDASGGGDE